MPRIVLPAVADVRALFKLAVPIVFVQVGLMLMSVVDTIVLGHYSARALAASALGNLYFYGLTGFGMGTVWAIDPVVSQAVGAGDREGAALGIQRGLVIALAIGVGITLLCLPAGAVFRAFGQEADVLPHAGAFVPLPAVSLRTRLVLVALRPGL